MSIVTGLRISGEYIQIDMDNEVCVWTHDSDGFWKPSCCGHLFAFTVGGPVDSHFRHCPYCGQELQEQRLKEEDDEEKTMPVVP